MVKSITMIDMYFFIYMLTLFIIVLFMLKYKFYH